MALFDYHLCCVCKSKVFYDVSIADDYYIQKVERGAIKALCHNCEQKFELKIYMKGSENET